jgi:hypothetical protein
LLIARAGVTQTLHEDHAEGDKPTQDIVARAIEAMGGDAWHEVGAATAHVRLSYLGATVDADWADDWTAAAPRSRRAPHGGAPGEVFLTDGSRHTRKKGEGHIEFLPPDNQIVILAASYPAAALLQSLHTATCNLSLEQLQSLGADQIEYGMDPAQIVRVEQQCSDPMMPRGKIQLDWLFSLSTGLPIGVRLPVRRGPQNLAFEVLKFQEFTRVKGLNIPSSISKRKPEGQLVEMQVSEIQLLPNLPIGMFEVSQ